MNARDYKQCAPGEYCHIYNRGNAKEDIFRSEDDYRFFLLRIRQYLGLTEAPHRWFKPSAPGSFSIVAYCLMPNHFHFLIRQNAIVSTGKLIGGVCTSHAKYFNQKYGRVGHLFQDQFKQKNVRDNAYLLLLSAYIHRNPVSAGLVNRAEDWQWSSMHEYTAGQGAGLTEREIITSQVPQGNYTKWLDQEGIKAERRSVEIGLI